MNIEEMIGKYLNETKDNLVPLTFKYIKEKNKEKNKEKYTKIEKLITVEINNVIVAIVNSVHSPQWLTKELQNDRKFKRYTIFVEWPEGDVEEIDVDALNSKYAKQAAKKELNVSYDPGGKILDVVQRQGLYI